MPRIDFTRQNIFPNFPENRTQLSQYLSYVKRWTRTGNPALSQSSGQFALPGMRDIDAFYRMVPSTIAGDRPISIEADTFEGLKGQFRDFNLCQYLRYHSLNRTTSRGATFIPLIQLVMNMYAHIRETANEAFHDVPTTPFLRRRERSGLRFRDSHVITWKVDFIQPVGDECHTEIIPKFKGRCLLQLAATRIEELRTLASNNRWVEFIQEIIILYDRYVCNYDHRIANPRWRTDQNNARNRNVVNNAGTSVRSSTRQPRIPRLRQDRLQTARRDAAPSARTPRENRPSTSLAQDYFRRIESSGNNEDHVPRQQIITMLNSRHVDAETLEHIFELLMESFNPELIADINS